MREQSDPTYVLQSCVLPTEDREAFERLHVGLIAELKPRGTIQKDCVYTIACLIWRKQHLSIFLHAKEVHEKYGTLFESSDPDSRNLLIINYIGELGKMQLESGFAKRELTETLFNGWQDLQAQTEKICGPLTEKHVAIAEQRLQEFALAGIARHITPENYQALLSLLGRIDALIHRCVRRLNELQAEEHRKACFQASRRARHDGLIRLRP